MIKVGIIIGSTRPNRIGEGVAKWVFEQTRGRSDAEYELIDIKSFNLPLLDEPVPAAMSDKYTQAHSRVWSQKIASCDAFIFVTPEYNHGTSGALKNALDFLYNEWNNKVAGFVGYGSAGGTRSVEQLRLTMAELQIATVRTQMSFYLRTDFENFKTFKPSELHKKSLETLLEQIVSWGSALRSVRLKEEAPVIDSIVHQNSGSTSLH